MTVRGVAGLGAGGKVPGTAGASAAFAVGLCGAAQDSGQPLTKDQYLSWHKVLARKGWVAPSWPKEHGGTGWTPTQKYIWSEELARADALPVLPFGVSMLAPVVYTFGTDEQKA